MSVTPLTLVSPQQLTNATATFYTSTSIKTRIDKASFTNTDTNPHTVTVYLVPNGGSAANSNMITNAHGIAAGETWNCPDVVGQILAAGGTIQAKADANTSVTISVAGAQIS